MKIILLPKVYDELEYAFYLDEGNNPFDKFVDNLFNPNRRGVIYTSEKGEEITITIWSSKYSLVCSKAKEEGCLKAYRIKKVSNNLYNRILERGSILEEVQFISSDSFRYSTNNSDEAEASKGLIEEIYSNEEKREEYKKYEEYWYKQDKIRGIQEEEIKKEQQNSLNEYKNFNIDFDNSIIIFNIKEKKSYRNGDRIKFLSKECFLKNHIIDNNAIFAQGVLCGEVEYFDEVNRRLKISILNNDIIKILKEDQSFRSGFIWKDITGTKNILIKEKQALEKLFNCETSNLRMKEFVPDIKKASKNLNAKVLREEDFTNKFKELTPGQKEAIKGAINTEDIFLIQGPPGTGKTTVISEIVQYAVNNNQSVLLSSQTNLAVDNALQRIGDSKNVRAIRLGDEEKIEAGCEKYLLANRVKELQDKIISNLRDKNKELDIINRELKNLSFKYSILINSKNKLKELPKIIKEKLELEEAFNDLNNTRNQAEEQMQKYLSAVYEFEDKCKDGLEYLDEIKRLYNNANSFKDEQLLKYNIYFKIDYEKYNKFVNAYDNAVIDLEKVLKEKDELDKSKKNTEAKIKDTENNLELEKSNYNFYMNLSKERGNLSSKFREEGESLKDKIQFRESQLKTLKNKHNLLQDQDCEVNKRLEHLKKEAFRMKPIIEEIILSNDSLWKEYFHKNIITKKELLDVFRELKSFKKLYGDLIKYIPLIEYLGEYDIYLDNKNKLNSKRKILKKTEDQLESIKLNLYGIKDKLKAYESDKWVNEYLGIINKDILEVDERDVDEAYNFISYYEQKAKKVKLHNQARDIKEEWENKLRYYQEGFENLYVSTSNLIGATCLGIASTNNNNFFSKEFDYVIIDEAARSSSLELLIPMIRGRKIILVGDHKQLSPSIEKAISQKLKDDNIMDDEELKSIYGKSLFGITYEEADESKKALLDTQFRMHRDISKFVSDNYYNGRLINGHNVVNRKHGLHKYLKSSFYWVNTPEEELFKECQNGSSYSNAGEAKLVNEILTWLDKKIDSEKTVGIITPYSVQVNVLRELIDENNFNNIKVEINTIDAFQGREKNFIIMSLVRNNDDGKLGFISYSSRMNVAISRSQELLIIVGNLKFINNNKEKAKTINSLISYLDQRQSILSIDFFRR